MNELFHRKSININNSKVAAYPRNIYELMINLFTLNCFMLQMRFLSTHLTEQKPSAALF